MSLAEIKTAVDQLSPKELAELAAFIRERDNAAGIARLMKTSPKPADCAA
jgi:hypothetical protein